MKIKKNIRNIISIFLVFVLFGFTVINKDYFEITKQIEIFVTLYKKLNTNYVDELKHSKLVNKAVNTMLGELDPYTVFYSEQDIEQGQITYSEGIGIGADIDLRGAKHIITSVEKDRAADLSGLKVGDEIVSINNISIADFGLSTMELLKGKKGNQIDIAYRSNNVLNNTKITLDNVFDDVVPFYETIDGDIGYLILTKFGKKSYSQVKDAFLGLKVRGAKSIIIDLRGNPGGLLAEAINIVSLFVNQRQLVVFTKSKIEKYNKIYQTTMKPLDTKIPIVVLVDGHSASASEIVSGTLQDIDRAVIIGSRSFGKGLVQSVMPIAYGNQLKVTIARYYTPSGRCIQALDYANRDKEGKVIRHTANQYNKFTTKNGRLVYDGGGVMPDVVMPTLENEPYFKQFIGNHLIFDYATTYYHNHPNIDIEDFSLSPKDFQNFKKYVKEHNNNPLEIETFIEEKITNDNQFNSHIKNQASQLLKSIKNSKEKFIEDNKDILKRAINKEIIRRYIYNQGVYEYELDHDPVIQKAKKILKNPASYQKILNP